MHNMSNSHRHLNQNSVKKYTYSSVFLNFIVRNHTFILKLHGKMPYLL